ncbi:hypothetical protein QE369_002047 [Agrobacterium larrymoorei]|uniref:Uncharacterized protein n=1 Tax=Agrobacterium larrymoorei TaxID=160699 RepID=A0AAJ2B980_9HYPH|nr:hypothetical protein [Agrobacterium larrymoorei]MDR6101850.1 hypothetical protein [Agrobacterium larrymoorei]
MHWAWTSAYRDLTSASDAEFVKAVDASNDIDNLCITVAAIRDFAADTSQLPASFREPLRVYSNLVLSQFERWKKPHWLLHAVRPKRCSLTKILHISLAAFLMSQIIFIAAQPNIVAFLLDEPDFNARSIQNRVRSAIQVYMLLRFRYTDARLLWTYLVKRQIVPYGVTIAYTIVALHPGYTDLYDKTWFKVAAGLTNLAGQLAMTFPMTAWCAWEARLRAHTPALSSDIRDIIARNHGRLTNGVEAFHRILENADISRHMRSQVSNMNSDLDVISRVLMDGLPSHIPVGGRRSSKSRASKMVIWTLSLAVFLLNCFCYAATSFLLVNVAATAVFVLLVQGDVVRKDHQSLEDMLNIFSNLTSGNILTLPLVGIPVLIALRCFHYRLMKNLWAFWVLSVVQTVLNLTVSDLFGPSVLKYAEKKGWI